MNEIYNESPKISYEYKGTKYHYSAEYIKERHNCPLPDEHPNANITLIEEYRTYYKGKSPVITFSCGKSIGLPWLVRIYTKTLEEAKDYIRNSKIYVAGKGPEIYDKLIHIIGRTSGVERDFKAPFLYIERDLDIMDGCWMDSFIKNDKKELSVDNILSITIEEECFLKPFDKVLVRDHNSQEWNIDLFKKYDGLDYRYSCMGCHWRQCIPYDGNESLLGTSKKP